MGVDQLPAYTGIGPQSVACLRCACFACSVACLALGTVCFGNYPLGCVCIFLVPRCMVLALPCGLILVPCWGSLATPLFLFFLLALEIVRPCDWHVCRPSGRYTWRRSPVLADICGLCWRPLLPWPEIPLPNDIGKCSILGIEQTPVQHCCTLSSATLRGAFLTCPTLSLLACWGAPWRNR